MAVVGAIAAAVITPDRLASLFPDRTTASSAATVEPVSYKSAVSPDGAVTLDIPKSWGTLRGRYNITYDGHSDVGSAFNVGTNPQGGTDYGKDGAYVGVSREAADRANFSSMSGQEKRTWIERQMAADDWTIDGCVLTARTLPGKAGWYLVSAYWKDCLGVPGNDQWNVIGISNDNTTVVDMELDKSPAVSDATLRHIVATFAIQPSKIPSPPSSDSGTP